MLRCPVAAEHLLTEVAPGLWQCQECSDESGGHPWALSFVEEDEGDVSAMSVTWQPETGDYTVAQVRWRVGPTGRRLPTSLRTGDVGVVSSPADIPHLPTPVTCPPGTSVVLKTGMFSSALGEKLVLKAARVGRSAAGSSPSPAGARFPHRRKTSGR